MPFFLFGPAIFLFTIACGDTIFYSGFETPEALRSWDIPGLDTQDPWVRQAPGAARDGLQGLSVVSGLGHCLLQSVRWPANSRRVQEGLYVSFDFRLKPGEVRPNTSQTASSLSLLLFDLAGASGEFYSTPVVRVFSETDSTFLIAMNQRGGQDENYTPMEPLGQERAIVRDSWYHLGLFIRIRGDTLHDSLFLNDTPVGVQTIRFKDVPGMVQGWRLGIDRETLLPISSVDFDNVLISSSRTSSFALAPTFIFPCPYACLNAAAPVFRIAPLPDAVPFKWLEIAVDSGSRTLLDSLFIVPGPFAFSALLPERGFYSFKARYIDKEGGKRPWTQPMPFYVSNAVQSGFDTPNDSAVISIRPSARANNVFYAGDTLFMEFRFPIHQPVFYIDLGVRSHEFSSQTNDRFGVADSTKNIVFSISSNGAIFTKVSTGTNTWVVAPGDSSGQKLKPYQHGPIVFPLLISNTMARGMWTLNAYLTTDRPVSVSYFTPVYFFIQKPAGIAIRRPVVAVCLGVLIALVLVFIKLRKKPEESRRPSPSWIKLAEDIEAFLQANIKNQALSRENMAEQLHLDPRKLVEVFQRVTGKSPLQRLREIRMAKACELLKKTESSVSEVAFEVGYDDPLIFQRNFTKAFGMPPSQFRKTP